MIQYRLGSKGDRNALTALWHTCFGDTTEEIRTFWELCDPFVQVFCAFDGKKLCGMICALSVQCTDENGEAFPAAYCYALCTAPAYRSRGIAAGLLAYCEKSLKQQGIFTVFLVPAEPSLFSYYERLGYQTVCHRSSREASLLSPTEPYRITPCTSAAYGNHRELQLYEGFLSYPEGILRWQEQLCRWGKGGLYRIENADRIFYAAAVKRGDCLHIKELLSEDIAAAQALAAHLHCKRLKLLQAEGDTPYAMGKALSGTLPLQVYVGLALD